MKTEIEFDFNRFGEDGISVEVNGAKIATLHKHTLIPDAYYGIYDSSSFNAFCLYGNNFKMFHEVKPREIWLNGEIKRGFCYSSKEDAINNGALNAIKFVEVLD